MTKYHYFVSYQWKRPERIVGGGVGFGHVGAELTERIAHIEQITAIAEGLERELDLEKIVILSFQLLRIEEF